MAHPKGVLLERAAKLGFERPEFRTERTGPEHEPNFITDVVVDGEVLGTGQGGSKRTAEKRAAEEALTQLDARPNGGDKGKTATGDKGQPASRAAGRKGKSASGDKSQAARAAAGKTASGDKAGKAARTGAATKSAADAEPVVKSPVSAVPDERRANVNNTEDEMASEFDGPWPMFDDLLAAALQVAERRVNADLRGDEARTAIGDFALSLYKDLLANLGDVVEVDDEEGEDDEE
ncbi:MAG TPA: putative dsRNA-binding protein [Trueperaceae bacterium]|nr:putative dsRNA-binding protein [Trueperaceae bacterium]